MKHSKPIRHKEEVAQNPDKKIDQDFEDFPHGPAKKETIKPETKNEKKTADHNNKDGEKRDYKNADKKAVIDEQESDGSANAFDDK